MIPRVEKWVFGTTVTRAGRGAPASPVPERAPREPVEGWSAVLPWATPAQASSAVACSVKSASHSSQGMPLRTVDNGASRRRVTVSQHDSTSGGRTTSPACRPPPVLCCTADRSAPVRQRRPAPAVRGRDDEAVALRVVEDEVGESEHVGRPASRARPKGASDRTRRSSSRWSARAGSIQGSQARDRRALGQEAHRVLCRRASRLPFREASGLRLDRLAANYALPFLARNGDASARQPAVLADADLPGGVAALAPQRGSGGGPGDVSGRAVKVVDTPDVHVGDEIPPVGATGVSGRGQLSSNASSLAPPPRWGWRSGLNWKLRSVPMSDTAPEKTCPSRMG